MGVRRTIEIDGKEVAFKASAAIPRIYRLKFQRDIYKDISLLEKSLVTLIFFLLRCLRTLLLLWPNMQTLPFRMKWRNGWTNSTHFPSIRFCHS